MTHDLIKPREEEVTAFGQDLFNVLKKSSHNLFDPNNLTEKFLSWGMKDEELKVSLFRFVDVLANLSDASSVIRHVQEYFEPLRGKVPELLLKGLSISPDSLTSKVISRAIQQQIKYIAKRFIVGENAFSALDTLKKLNQKNIAFTVDLVGESAVSEFEADIYKKNYLDLIQALSQQSNSWPISEHISKHRNGPNLINISVKLSALYSQAKAVSTDHSVNKISEKLHEILISAKKSNAFVYIDMEDCSLTEITLEVFKHCLSQAEFKDYPKFGIVLQAYLKRTEHDLIELISWVKKRDFPIGVRLVKGAYWDSETILAKQQGWDIPVWQTKSSSDANYEKLSSILLDNNELIVPAFASHNVRSLAFAIKSAEARKINPSNFEIQTLYGMAEPIKHELIKRGFLVRDYCPIGELIPAMGYLVRRLLENTANEGFLKQSNYDSIDSKELLKTPAFAEKEAKKIDGFKNLPLIDFTIKENRLNLSESISLFKNQLRKHPIEVCPIVTGKLETYSKTIDSRSPEEKSFKLAEIGLADTKLCEKAIKSLQEYFPTWKTSSVENRAEILKKTAKILINKRLDIISAIIFESGKSWVEADADLAEAVDFLNYYQEQAIKLMAAHRLGTYPGELNRLYYEPRGITLVISPWNFPLAIPCGMFAAAIVTGNCAILKPAEQTSLIAKILFESFLEAGLPKEAAAFLPGLGEEIGSHMSQHPSISTIVFTGSKQVGLQLIEKCTPYRSGMQHVRRVITEMGGKNFIIVDDDADLDEAVKGVIHSAFGFQGQKCSACSVVIAIGNCHERFSTRLAEAVKSLKVGPSSNPENIVGPVIDIEAFDRINNTISNAKSKFKVLAEAPSANNENGYYISPIVFTDVDINSDLFKEEVFGPVLVLHKCQNFAEAIGLANKSIYGLTAGIFSRSPKNIELASKELNVGNLYINRGCTGALVMRQPFGGAKLSGVGSKAGGSDYLLQFLIPKAISENTMRRGFAPD